MAGHQRTADTPDPGGRRAADGRTPRRAAGRGRYTTDGHTCLRYGGREDTDTEGAPTWRQGRCTNTPALVHIGAKRREREGEGVVVSYQAT